MKKMLIGLILCRLIVDLTFASGAVTFSGHITPTTITIDTKNIYITDLEQVFIYSKNNYKKIKQFGKKGEGPGEFKISRKGLDINTQSNNIIIGSLNRISFFTKKGKYIKEINNVKGYNFWKIDNHFVGQETINENNIRYTTLNLYDNNLKKLKEICRKKHIVQYRKNKVEWQLFSKSFWNYEIYDDKIFVLQPINDFIIDVFDKTGKKLYEIKHKYKKIKFTVQHGEEVLGFYKVISKTQKNFDHWKSIIKFPKTFPAIRSFTVDNNKLYIRTYNETKNGSEFLIFNLKGKLLRTLYLPIVKSNRKGSFPYYYDSCPYCIKNGKLYRLIEDTKSENWVLHIDNIETK